MQTYFKKDMSLLISVRGDSLAYSLNNLITISGLGARIIENGL